MEIRFELTDEQVEAIARRAAELVLERMDVPAPPAEFVPWLTIDEAAVYLGCTRQRIYNLRTDGRLTRHREGSRALVARSELDALVVAGKPLSLAEQARKVA